MPKADVRITILLPESVEAALASLLTPKQLALPFWQRSAAAGDVLAGLVRKAAYGGFETKAEFKGAFVGGPGAPKPSKPPVALKRGQPPPPPLDE